MIYRSPFVEKSRQTTAFRKEGSWKLGYHTGVDRVCDTDRTLVAVCDGVVSRTSGCGKSYGNHIVYRTDDGRCLLYAHMKDKPELPVGTKIKTGQTLGTMGNTGNSSGAHLHVEIQDCTTWGYGKNLLDPNDFIDWDNYNNDFAAYVWKNGSTTEKVYQTVADCKAKKNSIGSLLPRETAACVAVIYGCYLLTYSAKDTVKCGFVAYPGGV